MAKSRYWPPRKRRRPRWLSRRLLMWRVRRVMQMLRQMLGGLSGLPLVLRVYLVLLVPLVEQVVRPVV